MVMVAVGAAVKVVLPGGGGGGVVSSFLVGLTATASYV